MSWSYRKIIKIAPGIHLNVSEKGVSSTLGIRGAGINVGQNGTYLNTGILGTGIYIGGRKLDVTVNTAICHINQK